MSEPVLDDIGSKRAARSAGALYLLSAIAAGVPLIYVPTLLAPGNASATARNVLASEMLLRTSMVSELTGAILLMFTAQTLYRLLKPVARAQASLMVTLVLLSVPLTFLNLLNEIAALTLLSDADLSNVFSQQQRDALAVLFLGLHADGANLTNIFWGLWLLPFGLLVIRSGFIPRFLGVWLIANAIALVSVSLTTLLMPGYLDTVSTVAIIPELGELCMMVWLLVWGVKTNAVAARVVS
jgi:hypothetical protein